LKGVLYCKIFVEQLCDGKSIGNKSICFSKDAGSGGGDDDTDDGFVPREKGREVEGIKQTITKGNERKQGTHTKEDENFFRKGEVLFFEGKTPPKKPDNPRLMHPGGIVKALYQAEGGEIGGLCEVEFYSPEQSGEGYYSEPQNTCDGFLVCVDKGDFEGEEDEDESNEEKKGNFGHGIVLLRKWRIHA